MKRILTVFAALAIGASAQVSAPNPQSRVAGRFVAYSYGQWSVAVYDFPQGTGTKQFSVNTSSVKLQDGRIIMPFSTNAPIYVGSELVTPSTIGSGCIASSLPPGSCVLTATFSQAHGRGEIVRSGTYGLQEALNDAGASGGGAVTTDSAWSSIGGTSAMISAATKPANTAVEDVRTGAASGTFTALTQDATSTSSGGTTEVVGLLTHPCLPWLPAS